MVVLMLTTLAWSRKLTTTSLAPGMRLRRGYEPPPEGTAVQEADPKAEEADEAAAAQSVSKLLLVVHGIGQNLSGSNIAGWALSSLPRTPGASLTVVSLWTLRDFAYVLPDSRMLTP